jgi:putative transposase
MQENLCSPYRVKVKTAAEVVGASKSGYYKWLKRKGLDSRTLRNQPIVEKITKVIEDDLGYGYRRITAYLRNNGDIVNHKRVLRLMRIHRLIIRRQVFHPMTTDSEHNNPIYPNLIRGLRISHLNQVWASDITYIPTKKGFVYLTVVMDLFSRRIIGWSLSRALGAGIALDALQMALYVRRNYNLSGLIFHSDRGVQFTAMIFRQCLRDHGIQISNSRKAYPYDNAFVESFFSKLKEEEIDRNEYEDFKDVVKNIHHFIEEVYNAKRMHSSLGYISPIEFETQRQIDKFAS